MRSTIGESLRSEDSERNCASRFTFGRSKGEVVGRLDEDVCDGERGCIFGLGAGRYCDDGAFREFTSADVLAGRGELRSRATPNIDSSSSACCSSDVERDDPLRLPACALEAGDDDGLGAGVATFPRPPFSSSDRILPPNPPPCPAPLFDGLFAPPNKLPKISIGSIALLPGVIVQITGSQHTVRNPTLPAIYRPFSFPAPTDKVGPH